MRVRIAGVECDSVVDGPGIRTTVFFQGCKHNCLGCHNPKTHSYNGGYEIDCDELVEYLKKEDTPVTFSGGEPIDQLAGLFYIIEKLGRTDCWIYTGYDYEQIADRLIDYNVVQYIDCIVDGEFKIDKKSMDCRYRGSTNQRLVDIKKSTKDNVVEWQSEFDVRNIRGL